eukprot:42491-Eustigmatos_ZCMA.PRE.1
MHCRWLSTIRHTNDHARLSSHAGHLRSHDRQPAAAMSSLQATTTVASPRSSRALASTAAKLRCR